MIYENLKLSLLFSESPCFLKRTSDGILVFGHFKVYDKLNKEIRATLTKAIIKKYADAALKSSDIGQNLPEFQ